MPYLGEYALLYDLVNKDHVALDDEPLLLAVYYASEAAPTEECLFEVARNFGFGGPDEDKHIFQIQFGPTAAFPLPEGDALRLSLTNPVEFRLAVAEGWPEVTDLQKAIQHRQYKVLYQRPNDEEAEEISTLLGLQPEPQLVAV
jgi:hypothetical protein